MQRQQPSCAGRRTVDPVALECSSSRGDVCVAFSTLGRLTVSCPAGLYSNHPDLSPRYASVLLGITNTSGALPGIVGVATTGGHHALPVWWLVV